MPVEDIPQFGLKPDGVYRERISAYAVVFNEEGKLLALKVREMHHLPGGGVHPSENPERAVMREILEEAGCVLDDVQFLGKANQFLISKGEPVNKIGTFFTAELVDIDPSKKIEEDHEVVWLLPEEFIDSKARDFQKWAVQKALE